MQAWVSGELLSDPGAPVLSVDDHGVTVGDGVFEAVKIVDGMAFALDLHLDRLAVSAGRLGLDVPDRAVVLDGIRAVLGAEHLALGRLRITLTAGRAPMGSGRGTTGPSLIVASDAMSPWPLTTNVATVRWPRNERGALAGIKTTSYAVHGVALGEALRRGAPEAIFANLQGHLCEGTGSNVFYVVDGELRTPTLASGCLAGVTRALLVRWLDVREVDEPLEVAAGADEIFLASTTRDVQPVARWDDRALPAPGPVTLTAQQIWQQRAQDLLSAV